MAQLLSPLDWRRSNQSILKEIGPEYSLEGLMLKLQYFGHLIRRTDPLEKTLILGKIEGRRRGGQQRMRWLDGNTDSMDMRWASSGSWWWTRKMWHAAVHGAAKSQTRLSYWTTRRTSLRLQGLRNLSLTCISMTHSGTSLMEKGK